MGLSAHPARMLASSTEKGLCFRSFLASAKAAGWVRMLSWDDFRYVKAIAEARSLAGAGEHLGVNIPRCSVGSARSSSTSARACSSAAAPVMRSPPDGRPRRAHVSGDRRLRAQGHRPGPAAFGELRITASDVLLRHLLSAVFVAFRRVYPQIILDIVVSNQRLNLTKRDADVAVRAAYQSPEPLAGAKVARIGWAVFGAASLASEPFDPVRDGHRHDWLAFADALSIARAT